MPSALVIEHDHDIRVLLRVVLEEAGFTVLTAANGADGLLCLARNKSPDVILLDWYMPVLNGEGFLKAKMQDPSIASIPTIVLSGDIEQTKALGITEFISRPIHLETLLKRVRKYGVTAPTLADLR